MRLLIWLFVCWLATSVSPAKADPRITSQGAGVARGAGGAVNLVSTAPTVQDLIAGRTYTPKGTWDGGAVLRDLLKGDHIPKALEGSIVQAERKVPWAAIARGVGRAAPYVATALVIKDIWDAIRCKPNAGATGAECDAGQPEQNISSFCWIENGDSGAAACRPTVQESFTYRHGPLTTTVGCYYGGVQTLTWTFTSTGVTSETATQNTSGCPAMPGFPGESPHGTGSVRYYIRSTATNLQCPPITVNGAPFTPTKGIDDLCPTGVYTPTPPDVVGDKANKPGLQPKLHDAVPHLDAGGVGADHGEPRITGTPPYVFRDRTTTNTPGGGTTTTDRFITITPRPEGQSPGGWDEGEVTTTTTYPPGTTVPPAPSPGNPTGTLPTTGPGGTPGPSTSGPATADEKGCGLPDTPKCKIDETGTPTTVEDPDTTSATGPVLTSIASIGQYAFPTMNWSFQLPTGCAPIPAGGLSEFFGGGGIDICPYQPMFHDVMGIVWLIGGLFGAIGLFWRDQLAGT